MPKRDNETPRRCVTSADAGMSGYPEKEIVRMCAQSAKARDGIRKRNLNGSRANPMRTRRPINSRGTVVRNPYLGSENDVF